MSKTPQTLPVTAPSWYLRDRGAHRFGPYTVSEIRQLLRQYRVGAQFNGIRPTEPWSWPPPCPIEFVLEDDWGRTWEAQEWRKAHPESKKNSKWIVGHPGTYRYRSDPVPGIRRHKASFHSDGRSTKSRIVRDTHLVCREDGEPELRGKRRLAQMDWDDWSCSRRARQSWKQYRRHQWKD
mgnify:CR=1 FL=1